jgi:hypothetical protein
MHKLFIEKEIKYTGAQLSPHWIYKNFKLQGDAIVAFLGEVEVCLNEMVDIEDVINKEPISSKKMLNFIGEIFEIPLTQMIFAQRMLIVIIKENLEKMGFEIVRFGDDLFFEGKKLSVSIATKSITSSLIHTGLNVVYEGAPIEVSCLNDFGIKDYRGFALKIMKDWTEEICSIKNAKCKVRGV